MSLYGLPFDGIKGIRAEKTRLEGDEAKLDTDVAALKRAFVDVFGFSLPINLVRVRNNAYSPVMWRDLVEGQKSPCVDEGGNDRRGLARSAVVLAGG